MRLTFPSSGTARGTLETGSSDVGLRTPESDSGVKQGLEHFGFDVTDIDAEIKRLAALGAPLVDGPNMLPDGTRFCWVAAPDNVRIELIQWPAKS
jgi:catechol 2,3-dioxygenase-like lactoylglutathione lyase family enzyme